MHSPSIGAPTTACKNTDSSVRPDRDVSERGDAGVQYEITHVLGPSGPASEDADEAEARQRAREMRAIPPFSDPPTRDVAPLPAALQSFYRPLVGGDLSRVRVHTGSNASLAAATLSARAYTVGDDITFGADEFVPRRPDSARLLAHELTHVVQGQRGAPRRPRRQAIADSGLSADDVIVRNAPLDPAVAAYDPLTPYPTIAAVLDTDAYRRLQRILSRYRPFEPVASDARGVSCSLDRLLGLDSQVVPAPPLAAAVLPYLLNSPTPPGVLALVMRNETLRRFLNTYFPQATATVSIEIQPVLGPPAPRRARGIDPIAGATPPELAFVVQGRRFPIGDGLLHLSQLDEATGGQLAAVGADVIAEVTELADQASHVIRGRVAQARLPGLVADIVGRPKEFAVVDVRELRTETSNLALALLGLSSGSVPELRREAAPLVADIRRAEASLQAALDGVERLHQRSAVGSTTAESADYLSQESARMADEGMYIGSVLMAQSAARFRVGSGLLDALTGGAISDLDESLLAYRAGRISLSAYNSLTRHAAIKAGLAIGISIAASMLGGWLGGLAGRAAFGAGTLGMSMTAGTAGGAVGGVSFVGVQDAYSLTTAAFAEDPFVQARMRASVHGPTDYLLAGGLGGALGLGFGALTHTPRLPASRLVAPEPVTLFDASGRPIRVAGGHILPPSTRAGPGLLGPDGQPLAATVPPQPLLLDAAGRPVSTRAPAGGRSTLTGGSRLVGPSGAPIGDARGGVPPILVDAHGRPLLGPTSPTGPVIVDLQSGTTAFLDDLVAATPGARGVGVESGRWMLAYQGVNPTHRGDLEVALGLARNAPVWPDTPAWRTPLGQTPRLLPWEIDPAAHMFPGRGPVTVLPEPFFPASGYSGRLVPFGSGDIPAGGIQPTTHPALHGIADQIYLRRPFGLAFSDPATTHQLGQELNRMLKPGGFVEFRLLGQKDLSIPAAGAGGLDQSVVVAAQIERAQVVRVDRGAIQRFLRTGDLPTDPLQAAVLRNAASDVTGLGEGSYARIIRIYKGQ